MAWSPAAKTTTAATTTILVSPIIFIAIDANDLRRRSEHRHGGAE